jgi:hypothetical protein
MEARKCPITFQGQTDQICEMHNALPDWRFWQSGMRNALARNASPRVRKITSTATLISAQSKLLRVPFYARTQFPSYADDIYHGREPIANRPQVPNLPQHRWPSESAYQPGIRRAGLLWKGHMAAVT